MSKKSYCDDKVEEIRKGNIRKHSPQRSRANRGDDDNRDWRTRRDEDRKNGFRGGARGGGEEAEVVVIVAAAAAAVVVE